MLTALSDASPNTASMTSLLPEVPSVPSVSLSLSFDAFAGVLSPSAPGPLLPEDAVLKYGFV